MNKFKLLIISVLTLHFGCERDTSYLSQLQDPILFRDAMKNLSNIVVYDIFSPPVASRVYVYPSIAAYETMRLALPDQYQSLSGQIKGLTPLPEANSDQVNYNLAALLAFNKVGKMLIFSEDRMEKFQEALDQKIRDFGVPRSVRIASENFAETVAIHIKNWADGDNYNQTRTFPKYTILDGDRFWKPTPPDYMDGIEPHWNQIRTMVLDSAGQFPPKDPLPFDLTKGSPFQKQLQQVYEVGGGLGEEELAIAKFWDCNPYVTHHRGHAMFATKKITPGGHWIGITNIVTKQAKSDFGETINAFTNVSIALFDAFISCWDEKYRSNLVRPETIINKLFDPNWSPILQTPPFPEYTSGHSVISTAASVILTKLFGSPFEFEDDTEVAYNLPIRTYKSFSEAANEAVISRLYGGIHYRKSIVQGSIQGSKVGHFVVNELIKDQDSLNLTN